MKSMIRSEFGWETNVHRPNMDHAKATSQYNATWYEDQPDAHETRKNLLRLNH